MSETLKTANEHAGLLLMQKDENEERHNLKKTEEEIFEDFQFNMGHEFMELVKAVAEQYAETGEPFVLYKRIVNMTDDSASDAAYLYYHGVKNGEMWRHSGDALITKWLKDEYPSLNIPRMHLWTKGTRLLLEAYPERFGFIREAAEKRIQKAKKEVTNNGRCSDSGRERERENDQHTQS